MKPLDIKIRKYPYPYKCALTICNDINECSPQTFLRLHQFLNSTVRTECGYGLGLEIADSFWLFSNSQANLAFFNGSSNQPSEVSPMIEDFIRTGYIDCLHTFGDFCPDKVSKQLWRKAIAQGLSYLRKKGLLIDTWINHGPASYINLIARNHLSFLGDDPDSNYYHSDLLINYGIRYVWLNELNNSIIHEVNFKDAPLVIGSEKTGNILKNIIKYCIGTKRKIRSTQYLNSVLEVQCLRDKNRVLHFKRFHIGENGIWRGANREGLQRQFSDHVLKNLIKREGVAIIYTHLGKTNLSNENLFDRPTIDCLRHIAEESGSGRIFITTTSRLLNFITRRDGLKWKMTFTDKGVVDIHLKYMDDPIDGPRDVNRADLEGICFTTSQPIKLRIWMKDHVQITDYSTNSDGNRYCTGFVWKRLKFPEKYC